MNNKNSNMNENDVYEDDVYTTDDVSEDEVIRTADQMVEMAEGLEEDARKFSLFGNRSDDVPEEAEDDGDEDADEKAAGSNETDELVKFMREKAKRLRATAERMYESVGKVAGEAGDKVKSFTAEHQDEIDRAKAVAADAADKTWDALKVAADKLESAAKVAADKTKEAAKIAADKTKEAWEHVTASAAEEPSDDGEPAAAEEPFDDSILNVGTPDGEEPVSMPEYSMEYVLGQLEMLRREDYSLQNEALIKTYTKMYEDLRDREHREKLQKIEEIKATMALLDDSYPADFREKMFLDLTAKLRENL
ncbi:MAG: hypothetical protein MJ088_01155 [Clostridia bacterium]|nr:hypothetical protein [Clostridia bacterium]